MAMMRGPLPAPGQHGIRGKAEARTVQRTEARGKGMERHSLLRWESLDSIVLHGNGDAGFVRRSRAWVVVPGH